MKRFLTALTALTALFSTEVNAFQTPITNYKVLLTVGMDEFLPSAPVAAGPQGYAGFQQILGWSENRIAKFRSEAINWYRDRFGIDFTGLTADPVSKITFFPNAVAPTALLIPITFVGNYRVLNSNNKHFKTNAPINAFEYIISFTPGIVGTNYGGTYGASASTPPIAINPTDTVDFANYLVIGTQNGKKQRVNLLGRSYYPNRVEPVTDLPPRITAEWIQMYTRDFGGKHGTSGAGWLSVAIPSAPNGQGLWPTFVRGTWSFEPATTVLTDLDVSSDDSFEASYDRIFGTK